MSSRRKSHWVIRIARAIDLLSCACGLDEKRQGRFRLEAALSFRIDDQRVAGWSALCRYSGRCSEVAQHVRQDATMAVIFNFVQRIDAADDLDVFAAAIGAGDLH